MSILEVNNVSIRYMTGDFKDIGIKEYVTRRLRGKYEVKKFWADKHVTFSLEKGDMLGIIGTNGAGKSTLLKAISGIMEPTEGYVHREGTIAALLELASGFDGDLTVRENTYLRGAMLGYTRKFMNEMYDQIIEFADLKEFEDRPFKQLSSGMKERGQDEGDHLRRRHLHSGLPLPGAGPGDVHQDFVAAQGPPGGVWGRRPGHLRPLSGDAGRQAEDRGPR